MASAVEKVSLETARTPAPRCLLSVAVVVPYRVSFIPPVGTSTWIHHILSNRLHARLPSPPLPQSPNDERTYRAITLDNGLKIVVVHDATSDTAAAAVNVRAPAALFHEKSVSVVVPRVVPLLARVSLTSSPTLPVNRSLTGPSRSPVRSGQRTRARALL